MNSLEKCYRFWWRVGRNLTCLLPVGRNFLYPAEELASRFGLGDAKYAWNVFNSHREHLERFGFNRAKRLLEVGPGRNLGTALLWWCYLSGRVVDPIEIVCWDVFKNAAPEKEGFWKSLSKELMEASQLEIGDKKDSLIILQALQSVASGELIPDIKYDVMPLQKFRKNRGMFDLVYSQAAIEHIWFIDDFWDSMAVLTMPDGWCSHRIDLADHGRRETNYIEFLQWSGLAYWVTQRFTPGALNRWRASHHLRKLKILGFQILQEGAELRDLIPIDRRLLARPFSSLEEKDLKTTGLDLVAKKNNI